MDEKDLIVNCFDILIKKEINVKYLLYCFTKRRGLRFFNQTNIEGQKLTKDEWELFKKVLENGKFVN